MKYISLLTTVLFVGLYTANAQKPKISFRNAFAKARHELGAKGVFEWNSSLYTTEYAEELDEKDYTRERSYQLITLHDSISYAVGVDISHNEDGTRLKGALNMSVVTQGMNDVLNNNNRMGVHSDQDSYSVGVYAGIHMVKVNDYMAKLGFKTLNIPMVTTAINDVLNYRSYMTRTEARDFYTEWGLGACAKCIKDNLRESEHYIDSIRQNDPKIKTTESGLLYEIIELGDRNIRVKRNSDDIVAAYKANLKNGTAIYECNSDTMQVNRFIEGWAEGIRLIGKGGKMRLIIHPDLAHGQNMDDTPPNSVLLFEVELIDVIHKSPFRLLWESIKRLFGVSDEDE